MSPQNNNDHCQRKNSRRIINQDNCSFNEFIGSFFIDYNLNNIENEQQEQEAGQEVLSILNFIEQRETVGIFFSEASNSQAEFTVLNRLMGQVERIQLKWSKKLSNLCHLTKNLWNHANWLVRMRYFFTLDPERLINQNGYNRLKGLKGGTFSAVPECTDNASLSKLDNEYKTKKEKLIDRINKPYGKEGYHGIAKQMRYREMWDLVRYSRHYKRLPAQLAQQTLKLLDKAWKGYFKAKKEWRRDPSKFPNGTSPCIPGYQKKNGEFVAIFTNQLCKLEGNHIIFPFKKLVKPILKDPEEARIWNKYEKVGIAELTKAELYNFETIEYENSKFYKDECGQREYWNVPVKIRPCIKEFQQVRIVPKGSCFMLEIVYQKPIVDMGLNREHIAGIDIGVNNLLSIVNNVGLRPNIIKGKGIKAINQFANKRIAQMRSALNKNGLKDDTIQMKRIFQKRENRIHDYFHKTSRYLINYCILHDIGRIIIGYNPTWKQNINIGKQNSQNFVYIPFLKLIKQIQYKAELVSIQVDIVEESYTSQTCCRCGRRKKSNRKHRGLYVCDKFGLVINSDVSAGINIVHKLKLDVFKDYYAIDMLLRPTTVEI